MPASLLRPPVLVPAILLLGAAVFWQAPFARLALFLTLLLFSMVRALASVLARHRLVHLLGGSTPAGFWRNLSLEMLYVLLAMALAALLGRQAALLATRAISAGFVNFVTGIAAGLLAGTAVGAAMHLLRRRFFKD